VLVEALLRCSLGSLAADNLGDLAVGAEVADGGDVSTAETSGKSPATAADYLAILRRRKWIIIVLPILTAAVAYSVAAQESPLYRAASQVRFVVSNASTQAFDIQNPTIGDPTFLPTQATIARERELAERVADESHLPAMTADAFLGESSATPRADVNILDLSVTDANASTAIVLANAYADQFRKYKVEQDTATINTLIKKYDRLIRDLRKQGGDPSGLLEKKLEAEANGSTLANNVRISAYAEGASKTRPMPRRVAILGGLLGAVLALGIALLAEALDRRVRSEGEFEQALGLPLLGRLPRPARRYRGGNRLLMLEEPTGVHAETFRKLRTSVEFTNFERNARTIMFTSAGPREGKSTTAANLAIAFARAGRRVALVDLDLRRPILHAFFRTSRNPGFTDVVVERVSLEEAIRPVALPGHQSAQHTATNGSSPRGRSTATNGRVDSDGLLHLLPCGTIPPAADEFLVRPRVENVLDELSAAFDLVLVDSPPLLAVGDAQTLSARIDAMIVVTRLGIHRPQLEELARQLPTFRAELLGFILTGVPHSDSYSYGYGYDPHVYEAQPEPKRRGQRV
jgi:succinoglycan biosynthesis transport protein ExoP